MTINGGGLLRLTENALPHLNQPPVVSAGSDQTITLPNAATLNGSVTDDGLPQDSSVNVGWSKVSGPGDITFATTNTTVTTATFSQAGTYVLRLTASDSELDTSAEITVAVLPQNQFPIVSAGADQTITLPDQIALQGIANDDGLPAGAGLSVSWSKVEGPGTVTFGNATALETTAKFSASGNYLLRLTASDSELTTTDDLAITVRAQNQPPNVNAGADQIITLPSGANLNGSVSDDGLPAGSALTTTWSKLSGPGIVNFSTAEVTVTSASFSQAGTYVLRLSATDSDLSASDDVTITVIDSNVPPHADFVVPQSTGTAGAFVIASSGFTGSAFAAAQLLDANTGTYWQTQGISNQFAKMQFFDQQMVFIDRVRLQAAQGAVSNSTVKDFEVRISSTNEDDASFATVLSATLLNTGQLQEFVFAGGPMPARYIKLVPRNNYGNPNNIELATFNPVAVGSADSLISLPGRSNVALSESPALAFNGGAIYTSSYPGGASSPNNLPGYFLGGWQTSATSNQFVTIQLGGEKSHTLEGIRLATWYDSGGGFATAVKDFEIWTSHTTPDDPSFTRVLSASTAFVPYAQQFLFPGGSVQARYVKYRPLNNWGGGPTINTQAFDVIAAGTARVIGVSAESGILPSSAQAAFDGLTNTNWIATGSTTNVWVKTALAGEATHQIYGVRILPLSDISHQQGPKDFEIRVSTTTTGDSAFTTIYSGTMAPVFNSPPQEFLFGNLIEARYVQFVWQNSYTASLVAVKELEVLAAPDLGSAIVGFSSQAGNLETAANVLDLDPVDRPWVTASGQNTNQWLKLVLPRAEQWTINHIALRPGPAANDLNRSPKDFELQVSTTDSADGSFTTILAGSLINSSQLQDFYFQPMSARYVKLLLKNNYGSGQIGLSSFYIFATDLIGTDTRFVDRSTDPDGRIVSWNWNFGDGTTSSERNPFHTFSAPGDYTVSLTVTDEAGLSSTRQAQYHVAPTLKADLACSPVISHEGGELVRFTDTTSLLVAATAFRHYDFADGSAVSQSGDTSFHTFQDNGNFSVRLRIGDPLGIQYAVTRDVTVLNLPPSVDIDPGHTIVWGQQWTSVPRISDQSAIDRQSLQGQWDFGDGQKFQCVNCTNANASVTRIYSKPGNYNAALTITDKDGGIGFDSAAFTVNKRPTSLVIQSPPAMTSGAPLIIRAELRDTFANQPLGAKPVRIILNGAIFNAVTGPNGVTEISVPMPAGTRLDLITGSFAEDGFYLSSGGAGVPPTAGATPLSDTPSHQGKDFWLMFPNAYFGGGFGTQKLFITSAVSTSGTVAIPGLNFAQNFSVPANATATVTLPLVQVFDSDVIQLKGVHVTSQQPVTVYGMNQRGFTSGGFLALPVNSLGTDHLILTYSNMGFSPSSELGIVAADNGTIVTITPSVTTGNHVGGVPYTVALNQGQTYLLQNTVPTILGDLSGSQITSGKPVAVFGGHMAATIPAEAGCCADHLVEQLPPTSVWGKRFATIPLATRSKGDFFRFIAAENGTAIYLNGTLTANLNRGEFAERILKDPAEIIATRPIMLAQYSTSIFYDNGTTGKADPLLMIVPPYSQFLNHYVVTTPPTGFTINYANVVAPTALLSGLTIDGVPVPSASFSPIGASGFSGAQIPLSVGAHTLDGPAGFGVLVYGYAQDEGYGYPGGMNLSAPVHRTNVTLAPEVSSHSINTQGCVVATATDEKQTPLGGQTLNFQASGANPANSFAVTDAAGQTSLCYVGSNAGTDQILVTLESIQASASIVWTLPNQPPVVNAGADQSVPQPAAILQGSVSDDGLPANTLAISWSKVSGPGNVTFADPTSASTTVTFEAAGPYLLRLTANDTQLTASDDIQINVSPTALNQPPTANAGADQTVTLNTNLINNPGNEALLVNGEIRGWIEVQGTTWTQGSTNSAGGFPGAQRGSAYFYSGNQAQAELGQDVDLSAYAANIAAGTQQFEFKAYLRSLAEDLPDAARVVVEYRDHTNTVVIATLDSGDITSTGDWHLTEDTRLAPLGTGWVRVRLIATRNSNASGEAGNEAFFDSISLRPTGTAAVKLSGAVVDDGLPAGISLTATWGVVSGPGAVMFANPNAAITGATFTTAGTYVLRLTASDEEANAGDDVTVIVNPANLAPLVNAGTDQTITLPATTRLEGTVTDDGYPAGSSVSISWSKVSGPGVILFADSSQLTTTVSFSAAGAYVLRLTADDSEYDAAADVTITVHPQTDQVNDPPVVKAGFNQTISLPLDTVTLNGTATDDGLPAGSTLTVTWMQISGPGVVNFANANSAVTTAQLSVPGSYVLRLSASDSVHVASADMGIILTPENQAPNASAGPDQTILLSQPAQLNGSVSDDGLPLGSNLTSHWTAISGPGVVTFSNPNVTVTGAQFSVTGTYVLRLTASDGQLAVADELSVTVIDNVPLPAVEITSPADGDELTAPAIVNGSVSHGTWALEYSLNSDDGAANQVWTETARGEGPVMNGPLGTLDPTLMLNGIYSLRLKATDAYGQTSFSSISVVVDKNFKVGHFQIAFSDLNVPLAGLPIEVIRSYDSRDKRVGDFGVGWTLGLRSARVEKTGVLGFGWQATVSSGSIPTYCLEPSRPHKVAITFGDGKVFKFLASTAIHCQQFVPVTSTQLTFTPEPGTHATLEAMGPTDVLVETLGSLPGPVRLINQNNPDIFNAGTFRLTTAEGAAFVIDQRLGVRSVRDPYGNTLTIDASGIIHSSGRSIAFTRDPAGRITQITDPDGNAQSYSYDLNGDLVGYRDRENQTTAYTYNSGHHLLTITDARGTTPLQNQFDAAGRLIGQTDAFNHTLTYDHDLVGRVETITDRLGHSTRYEYDERGNVLRQVDAKGGVRSFTYDALDNVLTETNPLGKTTSYAYDSADNRTSVTDPLGHVTRFTYNAARQVLTTTDALDRVTTNTYDAAGTNLLTTTNPLGHTTTFIYSVFTGQRISTVDALNHQTNYSYDGNGRLRSETDALGHVTSYTYDINGNRKTQTITRTNAQGQPETITTSYEYDKLNRLLQTVYPDGSLARVEYNAIGQQSATIDQLGHRTELTYDDMGRVTRTDYADSTHEEMTYDAEGHRLTSKDRAGHVTSYTYDELGRLTKTTHADGVFTTTAYDDAGQVLTVTDARGNTTRYVYDDAGRRTSVRNALNQQTVFTHDANGNQLTVTDALGHTTTFEYDANNQRSKTIYADGTFDSVGYDALGRSVSKTDQAAKTTRFIYDALGRLTKVRDALNQETTYAYDEIGQQLSQTDANNHTTRFEYDQLGRRVKRILPLGQIETYSYDNGGNLQSRTDFNGKVTTFTYDAMRRLLSKVPDASLNQPTISFSYNANGQRGTMTDASGATVYAYDARHRLASKQTPFGALSYTYDAAGNLSTTRSSNANGVSVDYSHDSLNRLATVKDNNVAALNGGLTSYAYDAVGNLQGYIYPNNVGTNYNYNSLNRLTSMSVTRPGLSLAGYSYTLGAAGNRTAVSELSGRTINYTYDDLYRLTGETIASSPTATNNGSVSYQYDAVGNRLNRTTSIAAVPSQTSNYDANDRLTSDNYDPNGNTISANGNGYAYDFENRLTSLVTPNSSVITFVYDGDGNRVSKTAAGVTTNYLIDTNNPTGYAQVVEEIQGGVVTKQFTYGHDLISQSSCLLPSASCQLVFYGYDGHGSVRLLTDATAAVTDTYDYDAFGTLISRTGTTSNDYLYTGEQFDANLGFYYLRARYMNPSNGRFWTSDTFEGITRDPPSLHKYVYANGDCINRVDPSGNATSLAETIQIVQSYAISAVVFSLYNQSFHSILATIGTTLNIIGLLGSEQYAHESVSVTPGGPAAYAEGLVAGVEVSLGVARSITNVFVATRATTQTASEIASSFQGSARYPGLDRFRNIILRKGTIVYAGEPGVNGFFTTERTITRAGGDATKLFEGLQAAPSEAGLYRPGVTAFEIMEDTPAAFGIVRANPQYGSGGYPQVFVPDWRSRMKPVVSYILDNRVATIPH
ncbi:MAG: PKD domain-containing protein [Pyrinomonadaceae bacterium]